MDFITTGQFTVRSSGVVLHGVLFTRNNTPLVRSGQNEYSLSAFSHIALDQESKSSVPLGTKEYRTPGLVQPNLLKRAAALFALEHKGYLFWDYKANKVREIYSASIFGKPGTIKSTCVTDKFDVYNFFPEEITIYSPFELYCLRSNIVLFARAHFRDVLDVDQMSDMRLRYLAEPLKAEAYRILDYLDNHNIPLE